jgi:hypothetical protein
MVYLLKMVIFHGELLNKPDVRLWENHRKSSMKPWSTWKTWKKKWYTQISWFCSNMGSDWTYQQMEEFNQQRLNLFERSLANRKSKGLYVNRQNLLWTLCDVGNNHLPTHIHMFMKLGNWRQRLPSVPYNWRLLQPTFSSFGKGNA